MQRVQIQPLFSELRFYTLHVAALKQQKQQNLRAGLCMWSRLLDNTFQYNRWSARVRFMTETSFLLNTKKTSKAHISLLDIKVHIVQYWWEIMELLRCRILSGIAKVHMLNIRTSLFTTMINVVYYNVMKTEWEKPIDQSILFINRFKVELTFSLCKTGPVTLFSSLVK